MTDSLQAAIEQVLRLRHVEEPCTACHGLGNKAYGSTSTWRCGVGGSSITVDVCDSCWGTGDAIRTGVNLRRLFAEEESRIAERAVTLLGDKAGVGFSTMRTAVLAVAKELETLSKTRNKPRPPWFSLVCERVAKALRDGLEAKS